MNNVLVFFIVCAQLWIECYGAPLTITSSSVATSANGKGIKFIGANFDSSLNVSSIGQAKSCVLWYISTTTEAYVNCSDLPLGAGKVSWNVSASTSATVLTTFSNVFNFETPQIASIAPQVLDTPGGTLTITGKNFGPSMSWVTSVVAGTVPVNCTMISQHFILSCSVPSGTGTHIIITVTTFGGYSTSSTSFFRYSAPSLISAHGPAVDSSSLAHVFGKNFGEVKSKATLTINSRSCVISALNHTLISASCGLSGCGLVNWTVEVSINGQTASGPIFNFDEPTVQSISPYYVPITPILLTIHGDNFGSTNGVCTASLGSYTCSDCVVSDYKTAVCTISVGSSSVKNNSLVDLKFALGGVQVSLKNAGRWFIESTLKSSSDLNNEQESYVGAAIGAIVGAVVLAAATDAIAIGLLVGRKRRRKQLYSSGRYKTSGSSITVSGTTNFRQSVTIVDVDTGKETTFIALSSLRATSTSPNSSRSTTASASTYSSSKEKQQQRIWSGNTNQSPPNHTLSIASNPDRIWASNSGKPPSRQAQTSRIPQKRGSLQPEVSAILQPSPKSPTDTSDPLSTPSIADEQVFDPNNAIMCGLDEFPLKLEPNQLNFGLGNRQAPVRSELTENIVLTNSQKYKQHFRFYFEEDPKFKLEFSPESLTLKPESSKSVKVSLTCDCTSVFSITIRLIVSPGGAAEYNNPQLEHIGYDMELQMETQLTTRLDSDEISIFTPPIGTGAFGAVYKGKWRGQEVAVKVVKNQDILEGDSKMINDFNNEVAMMEKLRHPAIINFVGAVHLPLRFAILTEFAEFGNLLNFISKYHVPYAFKLRCLLNCAQGMAFLHSSGIIHRDLKPANLLVLSLHSSAAIVCKISDFGTTRDVNQKTAWKERMTLGVGTPIYTSPEVMDTGEYSTSADVFSFGVLMLQLFTEHDPYDEYPELNSPWKVCEFVISGKRVNIPKKCPVDYTALINASWAQKKEDRPTFAQIEKDIMKVVEAGDHFSKEHTAKPKHS